MDDMYNISLNYGKAINQANKLSKVSNKCRDIKSDIKKEANYVNNNWKGKTGDSLEQKLKELEQKINLTAENIERVSGTIKKVANDIKQADMDAIDRITLLRI